MIPCPVCQEVGCLAPHASAINWGSQDDAGAVLALITSPTFSSGPPKPSGFKGRQAARRANERKILPFSKNR